MRRKMVTCGLIAIDAFIFILSPFMALWLRFDGNLNVPYYQTIYQAIPIIVAIRLGVFYLTGLYRRLWRYASIHELLVIVGSVTLGSVVIYAALLLTGYTLPKSVHMISWLLNGLFVGTSRLFIRVLAYVQHKQSRPLSRVLIIGAGDAGAMLAREIEQRYFDEKKIVGFIDDDQYKIGQMMYGSSVLGSTQDISSIVQKNAIDEIIIAMPSVSGHIVRNIMQKCKNTGCKVKMLPGLYELIDGRVSVNQLRDVAIEDLLRRDPINLDMNQISRFLTGKRILVTGAGGSIGSEICRQVAKLSPSGLLLLGKGENSIYEIHQELIDKHNELNIVPVIADIRDENRIHSIFEQYQPQVVFHAAAHKHVPLMEAQPQEAVRNNIFGTKTVAEAADQAGAEVFIMISTDKAVNPTSVMGATKRVAELVIQNLSEKSRTKFAAVRFGNVLGSRGSVIPLFKKQIARGGPITITDPEMKRYFMTIPEATQLVLQAGAMAQGGEVFVLDMGEPVKILDMACDLIELSGLRPYKDIDIKFCGLRPGEKLFEELLTAEEGTKATKHKKIYTANINPVNEAKLMSALLDIKDHDLTNESVKELIHELIATYSPYRQAKDRLHEVANKVCDEKVKPLNREVSVVGL